MEYGISMGSNEGVRLHYLRAGRDALAAIEGVALAATSHIYETEPVGVQPENRDKPFLNAVAIVETCLSEYELLDKLHGIEDAFGRLRTEDRNAPRSLDMDILYAGERCFTDEHLEIPHPGWNQRRFVVQPLADVRPSLILPGETRTVAQVLSTLPREPEVILYSEDW